MNPIEALTNAIGTFYAGTTLLNYGIAVASNGRQDVRFVTDSPERKACFVSDGFEVVCFYVEESANPVSDDGQGRSGSYLEKVDYVLAVNAKFMKARKQLASIVNETKGIEYVSSDSDSRSVAERYFGRSDQNYETAFFVIRFRATENLVCPPC